MLSRGADPSQMQQAGVRGITAGRRAPPHPEGVEKRACYTPCVTLRSWCALAAACASLPAAALLIRPDRDEAEYLELASRYPSAIAVASGTEGVLINPRWILTTASGARALQGMPQPEVALGTRRYRIAKVHPHPEARDGQPENLALLQLADAVRGIEPVRIYREADEAGKALIFVSHGASGKRGEAGRVGDGRARAAINTVDRISPHTLSVRVKDGDEASDLQGVLTPGEEGAPAYIETAEGIRVAGLYHGDVTVWNMFSRLSAFLPWIEATMVGAERDEATKLLGTGA